MICDVKRKGNTLTIALTGELDHHFAKDVRDEIDAEIVREATTKLIFDLSALTFMDSSGIGMLLGRYKLMSSLGGSIEIKGASAQVDKLLMMAGLKNIIRVTHAGSARR